MSEIKSIYKKNIKAKFKRVLINLNLKKNTNWQSENNNFIKRVYKNYEDYKKHQSSKLDLLDLSDYDKKYKEALVGRYGSQSINIMGKSMLCLGARTGSECQAFIQLGAFSIGVDLNPGSNNKYVLPGDFHNLQFANHSIDIIYSNALDHVFDLEKLIGEVKRVLKQDGIFFVELMKGTNDINGRNPGEFESLWWDTVYEISNRVEKLGFYIQHSSEFSSPWHGTQIILKKSI